MPENQIWKTVGKIKDAHGLKGELYVLIFSGEAAWAKKLKKFKLGDSVFEAERAKSFKQGLILKPLNINDRNQSEGLKGLSFSIPADLLVSQKGETIYLSEIIDFEVFDQEILVGTVIGTTMNGGHDLLAVKMQTGPGSSESDEVVIEIPFVESYIKHLDWDQQRIVMTLPEGLISVQTETRSSNPEGHQVDEGLDS